jgi:high-affinity nickel permease
VVSAYGWTFAKPIRKLYYNLTTTATSIIVAVLVGGLQTLYLTWRSARVYCWQRLLGHHKRS